MPIIKVEVRLNYTTGLPEDVAVNTFHFDSDGTGDIEDVFDDLEEFYNTIHSPAATDIASHISPIVDRTTDRCEMFAYEVGVLGPPLALRLWTLDAAGGSGTAPYEVALCGSFASTTPGVPSARQRGRVYIGPLVNTSVGSDGRPSSALRAAVQRGCEGLAAVPPTGFTWGVYSRVNQAIYGITHGWVDNEFDTQRRRQVPATLRDTWSV